ncbi:MAG: double-cubane-cluster-containing anaerobic reductase [Peptococcaceae bacterium]|nr:double-cubane-cluster-containing anaerobic reductase [Peptococcaceae bacterium]
MTIKTDLPEIFQEFGEARRNGFVRMHELKKKGVPVVGVYCTFMPEELIMAAGAVKVGLCSTSDETIPLAEKDLPRNLCPLIKSSYGFGKSDKCPYFYFSDLVVGETTCDGKKKMFEYMKEFKDVYVMQMPNSLDSPAGRQLWHKEILRLAEKLEDFFQVKIQEDALRAAIHLKNRERTALKDFYSLGKLNPPAVMGYDIYQTVYGAGFKFEKEQNIRELNALTSRIEEEYRKGKRLDPRPRILITGSPIGGATEKVIRAIEENGGVVVAFENCTGAKPNEELVDEQSEPMEALCDKYIRIGCSCISPNHNRFFLLRRMIEEYQADGVVDMVLQACHPYAMESKKVRESVNIPYLYLETDFSQADVEQLNTRAAAFVEMLAESSSLR